VDGRRIGDCFAHRGVAPSGAASSRLAVLARRHHTVDCAGRTRRAETAAQIAGPLLTLGTITGRLNDWARIVKRDVHALFLACRDPRVPWHAKALAALVAGYALSPIDLIPDFIPVLGYLDDVIIVPLGILLVVRLIPPEIMAEHRALAAAAQEPPISRTAAVIIIAIWTTAIILCAGLAYRHFSG
jgi:uncharacterized membrane protein YkvA (DUF1232 family)